MSLSQTVTWVPVSEQLPENSRQRLVINARGHEALAGWDKEHKEWVTYGSPIENVTHWAEPLKHPTELAKEAL